MTTPNLISRSESPFRTARSFVPSAAQWQTYALEKGRRRAVYVGRDGSAKPMGSGHEMPRVRAHWPCPNVGRSRSGGRGHGRSVDSLSEGFKVVHRKPS